MYLAETLIRGIRAIPAAYEKTLTLHSIVQIRRVEVTRLIGLQDVRHTRRRGMGIERAERCGRTQKDQLTVGRPGGNARVRKDGGKHHFFGLGFFTFNLRHTEKGGWNYCKCTTLD